MRLAVVDDPDERLRRAIIDGLVAYNGEHAQPERFRRFAVVAQAPGGEVVGGALGETHWNWLFVSHLWLRGDVRGRGEGRRVMHLVESSAVDRGCDHVHLDTFGFQAPGFYETLGYQRLGSLDGWPPGSQRIFLWKRLHR